MANKQKFYAVRKGNSVGIFYSWEECQNSIKGCPGAEFKSFISLEEANAYLNNEDLVYNSLIQPALNQGKTIAFVDGSYNAEKQAYGSGVFILTPNGQEITLSKSGNNPALVNMRNVVGELIAVHMAVDWAIENKTKSIVIFYD